MIRKCCCSAVLFLLLLGLAGCAKKPTLEEKLKAFQGEWAVVQLNRAGKISDDDALSNMSVTVQKDRFQFFEGRGKGPVKQLFLEDYYIQIDPSKPTGDVDLAYATGDNIGMTRRGIYSLEDNQLKVCYGGIGAARPTDFAANDENGYTLIVLQKNQ